MLFVPPVATRQRCNEGQGEPITLKKKMSEKIKAANRVVPSKIAIVTSAFLSLQGNKNNRG